MKIIYNSFHGPFSLSDKALALYNRERINAKLIPVSNSYHIPRDDLMLIKVVESLGEKANGLGVRLAIAIIPDKYAGCVEIITYFGKECVTFDPHKSLQNRLSNINVSALTDDQCRSVLVELVRNTRN